MAARDHRNRIAELILILGSLLSTSRYRNRSQLSHRKNVNTSRRFARRKTTKPTLSCARSVKSFVKSVDTSLVVNVIETLFQVMMKSDSPVGRVQFTNDKCRSDCFQTVPSPIRTDRFLSSTGETNAPTADPIRILISDRTLSSTNSSSFYSADDDMSALDSYADEERRAFAERRVIEEQEHLKCVADAKAELDNLEDTYLEATSPREKKRLKKLKWKADRHLNECNQRLTRFQSTVQVGELTSKISHVENDVSEVKARQSNLESRQDDLDKKVAEESSIRKAEMKILEDQVAQLAAQQAVLYQEQGAMRKTVDQIDNRVRLQSLVFHGIDTSDPYQSLAKFLRPEMLAAIDVINVIGVPNDLGQRTSVLVRFVTIRDCQLTEDYLRSEQFRESPYAGTSWHHDSSELQRVGRTRMIACGDALAASFPSIELRATFIRFPPESGLKVFAQDFANSHVVINGTVFHVDAAVAANPDYVANPAAKVTHGGRTYTGVRQRNRGAGRGSNRGGRGGRGRGHGPSRPVSPTVGQLSSSGNGNSRPTSAATAPPPALQPNPTPQSAPQVPPAQFIVPQPKPTRMKNLTNNLPQLNGPSSRHVELFANGGNYGSSRVSNRVGGLQDRYAPNAFSRFSPYDVRSV